MSVIPKTIIWAFIAVTGTLAGIGLMIMNDSISIVLHPQQLTPEEAILPDDLSMEQVTITQKEVTLDARYLPVEGAKRVVFICHAGNGNLFHHLPLYRFWKEMGVTVFTFDYQGFGLSSPGSITPSNIKSDIEIAYAKLRQFRWPTDKIILYAQGILGAELAELGMKKGCAGLIIENAIPSLGEMMPDSVRAFLLQGSFDLRRSLPEFSKPVLLLAHSKHPDNSILHDMLGNHPMRRICLRPDPDAPEEMFPPEWKGCVTEFIAELDSQSPQSK